LGVTVKVHRFIGLLGVSRVGICPQITQINTNCRAMVGFEVVHRFVGLVGLLGVSWVGICPQITQINTNCRAMVGFVGLLVDGRTDIVHTEA
jgi:hypothetical protein